jgi:Tol biopolymer transport system component
MKRGLCLLLTVIAFQAAVRAVQGAQVVTASAVGPGSISAGGNSFGPAMSGDGRRIAFVSHAGNLVTNDTLQESLQVFVRELGASNTVLASVSTNGRGGNGNSVAPTISSNGQFVAFVSEANDLVDGDTNGSQDVFVRDLISGTTLLVSAATNGTAPFNAAPGNITDPLSGKPMISADGRWVFFESRATNLTRYSDGNANTDVFVRDLQSNSNFLLSLSWVVNRAANGKSELASITPNAAKVAFVSTATDLVAGTGNALGDVYVRDLETRTMYCASASLSNYSSSYKCLDAELSEDGRFVAFTASIDAQSTWLFRFDLITGTNVLVATNLNQRCRPQLGAEGRYLVFEDGTNVFRFDANTGTKELVNVTMAGAQPLSGIARNPMVTPDGNGIVFISNAPDLTTNASTGFEIYARDMRAGTTRLVTLATNHEPSTGSHEASLLAVSRDFSSVAFDSSAHDLVSGDGNRLSDVFLCPLTNASTELISVREISRPRMSGLGHAFLSGDSVSADGRYIAFSSYDTDLAPGDTNGWPDVFLHDTLTGTTFAAGISTNIARLPVLSGNGRYVVYIRTTPSVGSWGVNPGTLWRFDHETRTNELVSETPSGLRCAINSDGNLIAFRSSGTLFVRDMIAGTNLNLGQSESISSFPDVAADAVFTPDSRFLLFKSGQLFAYDFVSSRIHTVSVGFPGSGGDIGFFGSLAISGNSRLVMFLPANGSILVVHDLFGETNQVVNTFPNGPETLSFDGRFAALLATDGSFIGQIVVQDRQTGFRDLVSVSASGTPGTPEVSRKPLISGDGRFVVFGAIASNLVPQDIDHPQRRG